MVDHNTITDGKIAILTSPPSTAPAFVGQEAVVSLTGRRFFILGTGTSSVADWIVTGGTVRRAAGVPTSVTPDYSGQLYQDTDTGVLYVATGTGSGNWQSTSVSSGGSGTNVALFRETVTNGFFGGDATGGAWNIRKPNVTAFIDIPEIATLVDSSLGTIQLSAGKYLLEGMGAFNCENGVTQRSRVRFWNVTGGAQIEVAGIPAIITAPATPGVIAQDVAVVSAFFDAASPTTIRLEQYCWQSVTGGLGAPSSSSPGGAAGVEVYCEIKITKLGG